MSHKPRRSLAALTLLALLCGGGAALLCVYYGRGGRFLKSAQGLFPPRGNTPPPAGRTPSPAARDAPPAAPRSGLELLVAKTEIPEAALGPHAAGVHARFAELCRRSEQQVRALAVEYTNKYPTVKRYGADWMSYPDLRQLDLDYKRDRDPVKFLYGVATSPNFPKLVRRYAADPALLAFLLDVAQRAPVEAYKAVAELLAEDRAALQLAGDVARAIGEPVGPLATSLGVSPAPQPSPPR